MSNFIVDLLCKSLCKKEKHVPEWYAIARGEIGQTEISGDKNNPQIIKYHSITTFKAEVDEVPWCSSFVCWCMEQAGIVSARSAGARSWEHWGERIDTPRLGAICVFRRGNKAWMGHVGFYVGQSDDYISILGGNQNDSVCIKKYLKRDLICYRWPKA